MNNDPKASKISQISISSEVDYRTRKDIDAESYTLHLAMDENSKGQEKECTYYMWKQKFAVKPECKIQKRMEVDRWVVTLAFPQGQRLGRRAQSPGVYAFLPTEMVTNLPFIIQADFLLASSQEPILFDSQWNRGILECVPYAFVNAFGALLKLSSDAPIFALPPIFRSPANSILFTSDWQDASVISILPFIDTVFCGIDIADFRSELQLFGSVDFKQSYQLVVDNFRFSKDTITPSATILILKCIRYAEESQNFVERLKDLRWLKTDVGFRAPHEVFLVDDDWKCLLNVVDKVPLLDLEFYGDEIKLYKEELSKTGLIACLKEASKIIAHHAKKLVQTSSFTKERALALLGCYRDLSTKHGRLPVHLANFMHREKWLHTSLGFRAPKEAIFFSSAWEPVASISSLPFIDDSNMQYGLGEEIHGYRNELIALGSKVGLEQGASFVIYGLNITHDGSAVTPEALISLLKCIRRWRENGTALPQSFMSAINMKWFNTTVGYRHPTGCILFDSVCSSHVERDDGPFIDEVSYGHEIVSYESELQAIGVIVNARAGCALTAQHLQSLSNVDKISMIDSYLKAFRWKPRYTSDDWIWIPQEADKGQWVKPYSCVLYDRDSLFGSQLHVLVKWYSSKLLRYFNTVFGVKLIQLSVIIASSGLNDIYSSISVQKISKATAREESEHLKMEYVNIIHKSTVIEPGLLRIILAFLADPIVDISAEKRHEMVSGLINVLVYETSMPLTASYQVGLSSGRSMTVTSVGSFCWDRENSSLFVTKTDVPGSVTNVRKMEYAVCFTEEISNVV
ncbi:hypothetical protein HU200_058203 [Digitaria exilis]|uniref:Uncharacterized protein n=1 Tax=Digitaria exilis TaxID=1010633 RepID=A0A835AG06_9POAL|nr:hypothetical protein HU200_058203 [Digitaria exilis]